MTLAAGHGESYRAEDEIDTEGAKAAYGSLTEDIEALVSDTKTYVQSEIAFQKARGRFVSHKLRNGLVFGIAAFGFLHLALLGLVVGLIFALSPIVGPFVATALVIGALLLMGAIAAYLAVKRFKAIRLAFDDKGGTN